MREWSTLRTLMFLKGATGVPINEYTATGNPLTFETNVAKNLSSLVIPWTPVQSGSGDPSPENVRPISGVSGVNVYHSGEDTSDYDTIPVVFPAEAGTVYGGSLDLTTGVLTAEWAGFAKTWADGESATDMGSGITRKAYPMVDNLQTGTAKNMCNIAPYSANENADVHFYYSGSGSTNRKCRLFLPTETDGSTPVVVITNISVPLTWQLTPQQIQTLIGDNVIWSDTNGSNTAVYLKKG